MMFYPQLFVAHHSIFIFYPFFIIIHLYQNYAIA